MVEAGQGKAMRTELVRDVPVERYAVFAEMAWLQRRPELAAICRVARESGGRITPSVIEQALPGLTDVGAENVIGHCRDLELCDRSAALMSLGETVAETEEAPVPEQGVYDVWATADPLLGPTGPRILHVDRVNSTRDARFDAIGPIPVRPRPGEVFVSVVDPQSRFMLRSFPTNEHEAAAVPRDARGTRCWLTWVLDWDRETDEIRLDGTINARDHRTIKYEPGREGIDLWKLMEAWSLGPLHRHGRWRAGHRRLAVEYAGLSAQERTSFVKDLDLGDVEVPGYGSWSDVRLTDVPIGPATAGDAGLWAMELLDRRLRETETRFPRTAVRRLFAELTAAPALEPFSPTLPDHDTLLDGYAEDPEVFWRIAAPVDLAPFPSPPEELGPMTVGEHAPRVGPPDRPDRIWLTPGTLASMRTLVDRLTGGQPAQRMLLVDRYVRGEANLVSLEILTATLADQGTPSLDVWTGTEVESDALAEIQEITGRRPRRYRDIFGRIVPIHGRYVVVVPRHGPPFGWHLSDSLLAARVNDKADAAPTTPLRWRDLAANRLSIGQLPEAMADWAGGGAR